MPAYNAEKRFAVILSVFSARDPVADGGGVMPLPPPPKPPKPSSKAGVLDAVDRMIDDAVQYLGHVSFRGDPIQLGRSSAGEKGYRSNEERSCNSAAARAGVNSLISQLLGVCDKSLVACLGVSFAAEARHQWRHGLDVAG